MLGKTQGGPVVVMTGHLAPAVAMPSPKDTDDMCNLRANGAVEVVLILGNKC